MNKFTSLDQKVASDLATNVAEIKEKIALSILPDELKGDLEKAAAWFKSNNVRFETPPKLPVSHLIYETLMIGEKAIGVFSVVRVSGPEGHGFNVAWRPYNEMLCQQKEVKKGEQA